MLGELARQDEADRGLDLARGEGRAAANLDEGAGLARNAAEEVRTGRVTRDACTR